MQVRSYHLISHSIRGSTHGSVYFSFIFLFSYLCFLFYETCTLRQLPVDRGKISLPTYRKLHLTKIAQARHWLYVAEVVRMLHDHEVVGSNLARMLGLFSLFS